MAELLSHGSDPETARNSIAGIHFSLSGSQVAATERGHTGQHIQICESAAVRMF